MLDFKNEEMNEGRRKGVRLETNKKLKLNWTEGGRDDGRRETETFFHLTSPVSAIGRPGRETLKE